MDRTVNESILKLFNFLQELNNNSVGVDINEYNFRKIENLIAGKNQFYEEDFSETSDLIKNKTGYGADNFLKNFYYLSTSYLKWNRREQISGEELLSGGFYINGYTDLFLNNAVPFWQSSEENFDSVGCGNLVDDPGKLRWIEGTRAFNDPEKFHHYGCSRIEPNFFLKKYYFYDSGFIYTLPFKSVDDYLNAMTATAAVRCWQLFYIDPEIIISKNKGIPYITWALHIMTNLDSRLRQLTYDKDSKYDRLDLIKEYLKRTVDLLPNSFPFIDFTYHIKYFNKFKILYDKSFG